jgi:putative transposase
LNLSRATAYYQCVELVVSTEEIAIKNAIDRIHYKEPSYGVRRIKKELRLQGFTGVGKRLVRRYMDEMCICVFYPGPNLSKRDKQSKIYPYLLRNLTINRPNQVWSIDISYLGTPEGFVYLVAIIDWHSRFLVGWSISNTMQSDFVVRTVKTAVGAYGKPEIINSDQGSQFSSTAYIDYIKTLETVRISMDGRGRATDNIMIERFFRSYKWERLYPLRLETIREVKEMTVEYMEHYNYRRPHQGLGEVTPSSIYFQQYRIAA